MWRSKLDLGECKGGRVQMRASSLATVFEADDSEGLNQTLVASFTGEMRVEILKPFIRVDTDGEFAWFDPAINQTNVRSTDVVFTSLDRPSPLSPEMVAIQQMQMRNNIEREREREILEKRFNENLEHRMRAFADSNKATPPEGASAETPPVRDESVGVPDDSAESESGNDMPPPVPGAAPKTKAKRKGTDS